jgi:hypothetical protein
LRAALRRKDCTHVVESRGRSLAWSALLVAGGIIALLFNVNALHAYEPLAQYIVAGALALGGVGFFVGAAAGSAWWRLIPAWTLLALAAMVLVSVLAPGAGRWVAALLLWGMAAAFGHIYVRARVERWWALLPGGFLAVLGIVIAVSGRVASLELLGSLLFVGVGAVFFLVYALGGQARQWWALIPGSILLLFGLFVLTLDREGRPGLVRWWPVVAIAAGLLLALRSLRARPEPRLEVNRAPQGMRALVPAAQATVDGRAARSRPGPEPVPAPGAAVQVFSDPDD